MQTREENCSALQMTGQGARKQHEEINRLQVHVGSSCTWSVQVSKNKIDNKITLQSRSHFPVNVKHLSPKGIP